MIGSTLLNRYRIDLELGHGGTGTVYRAYDTTLGRDVAVKVISVTPLNTEGQIRFKREAQAIAKLNHPTLSLSTMREKLPHH